jgi:hypothetical protein
MHNRFDNSSSVFSAVANPGKHCATRIKEMVRDGKE